MEDTIVTGTPSMLMLPAKNYAFKVSNDKYMIKIPRKGSYHELDPDFFSEDSGEFNLLDEELNLLYLPSITKVLFASKQYPDLAFNQFFVPTYLKFEEKEVIIVGQIVDMLIMKKNSENEGV